MQDCVLCFDLGTGSGRLFAVVLSGSDLGLREIHRFSNEAKLNDEGELCWQQEHWLQEMRVGLEKAVELAASEGWQILSVGIDTWGVDVSYLGADGRLLHAPYSYRSERHLSSVGEVHAQTPLAELYASGGNAYFPFNTIYQLYHDVHHQPKLGKQIHSFLFTPDYLAAKLGGGLSSQGTAEYCIASTSGLCDAAKRDWNWQLIERLGLPREIFPKIVESPYLAGTVAIEGLPAIPIIKVASHDTASASVCVPEGSCFLVCGTWCIIGVRAREPELSSEACQAGLVNEGAALGEHRVQKLFCGFWLLQQLRKEWAEAGQELSHDDIAALARQHSFTRNERPSFDVSDPSLKLPNSMEEAVSNLLGKNYARPELLHIVYHSMALACADQLRSLQEVTGLAISSLYVLGGGSKDEYFTAELQRLCGCEVQFGPSEASVMGNAALQFLLHQKISNLEEFRNLLEQKRGRSR